MVRKINNHEVHGDNFVVLAPDVHFVHYVEDNKTAVLEIEGGIGADGKVYWDVYVETLRGWKPPNHFLDMSIADRDRILANVSESLDALEMPHRFS